MPISLNEHVIVTISAVGGGSSGTPEPPEPPEPSLVSKLAFATSHNQIYVYDVDDLYRAVLDAFDPANQPDSGSNPFNFIEASDRHVITGMGPPPHYHAYEFITDTLQWSPVTLAGFNATQVNHAKFSEDGNTMVLVCAPGPVSTGLYVYDMTTLTAKTVVEDGQFRNRCGVKQDGSQFATALQGPPYVQFFDNSVDPPTALTDPAVVPPNPAFAMSWKKDTNLCVVLSDGAFNTPPAYGFMIYDTSTNPPTQIPTPVLFQDVNATSSQGDAQFSPDGSKLAVIGIGPEGPTENVYIYDTSDVDPANWTKITVNGQPDVSRSRYFLNWNADGTRVLTSNSDNYDTTVDPIVNTTVRVPPGVPTPLNDIVGRGAAFAKQAPEFIVKAPVARRFDNTFWTNDTNHPVTAVWSNDEFWSPSTTTGQQLFGMVAIGGWNVGFRAGRIGVLLQCVTPNSNLGSNFVRLYNTNGDLITPGGPPFSFNTDEQAYTVYWDINNGANLDYDRIEFQTELANNAPRILDIQFFDLI